MQVLRKVTSWFLVFAVLVAPGSLLPSFALAQSGGADDQRIAQLERLFDALEAAAKKIPRDTFDLQAALLQTDLAPGGLLAWVRDNTRLVPYHGALRGERGVLMDRMGNSLDRALLLQGFLQLLGYDTRLARARLDTATAEDLLAQASLLPAVKTTVRQSGTEVAADLRRYALEFGVDEAQLLQAHEQAARQHEALQSELHARVEAQTEFLLNALGSPKGDESAGTARQVAALQDHWWVEYLEGGVWTALDPALPDGAPARTLATATETVTAVGLGELPSDLLHTLQIRMVLECALDAGLQETTLVESPVLIPADLLGQYIAINHVPVGKPLEFDAGDAAAFKAQVLMQDRWFPAITIGSQSFYDLDFTAGCEIDAAIPPWVGAAVSGAFGSVFDIFGGAPGMEAERVTALWIEYIVSTPGEADEVVRREVFDVLGPAARAVQSAFIPTDELELAWRLSLIGGTEILLLPAALSTEYVEHQAAASLLSSRTLLLDFLLDPAAADTDAVEAGATSQPGPLHALAMLRRPQVDRVFLDQLNILSFHKQLNAQGDDRIGNQDGFDIVLNDMAVIPGLSESASVRIEQGIIDTSAEALIAALICQDNPMIDCATTPNPSDLLKLMHDAGWQTVRTEEDLAGLFISADTRIRLQEELRNGHVILIPEVALQIEGKDVTGWWRIDPLTGGALGIGENGWGAAATEYGAITSFYLGNISFMICATAGRSMPGGLTDIGKVKCVMAGIGVGAAASGATAAAVIAGMLAATVASQ